MLLEDQRRKVIEVAREAVKRGLVILTAGNFSLRDPQQNYICLTPSGMNYEQLQPEDIVVLDLQGKVVEGGRKPSIEKELHCAVYRSRPDVFGVCHTHSPYATAWASVQEEFPLVLAELAAVLGDNLRTAPFKPMGSKELAQVTAAALGNKPAVLMSNHGQLAVGPDLDMAFANALLVEEAGRIAAYAKGLGRLKDISAAEARRLQIWLTENYGQD